jgi:hypothetical protein
MRYFISAVIVFASLGHVLAEEKAPPKVTFDDDVKPILQQKCFSCHNPDKKSADLDLTNFTNLMQGGASGAAVEPGDASASYLYELVSHASEPIMPPESPKIPDEMIETIRKWIEGGVLENSGSTAKATKKKKFDMGLTAPSTERPAIIPMPARMSLQPIAYTPHPTAVDAIATSPWAPLTALSSQKQVLLYSTQSLELVGVLPFPEGVPRVLKFSRNGKLLLAGGGVGGASGRVVVWDVQTGERIIEVGQELDEVLAADISSDQKLVALAGPLRVLRIYATETGQLLHEIRKHTEWVTTMEFSPDSVLLATGDRNGGLFVWEGWTGREYLALPGHTAAVTDVSWRSDSNVVASCSEDATIRLWEMENGGQVKNWAAHPGGALSVEFTRDSRLFSCGRDKTPKIWDQNGAQQIAFEAFGDLAMRATFCNESNRAISGDWTGEIRVWNAADGVRVGQLAMNAPLLEERLFAANQALVAKQAEQQLAAAAHQAAQVTFDKIKAEFAVAQQQSVAAKQKSDAAATALAAAKELVTKTSAEHETAKKTADESVASLPVVKDASNKAVAAAALAPEDKELAAAAEKMKATFAEQEKSTTAAIAAAAEKLAAMQKATADLAIAEKLATESAAATSLAQANEARLMPMLKPAEDAYAAAKAVFDQSSATVHAAQQLVGRWTDEIAFGKKLADLSARRTEAARALEEKETAMAQMQVAADAAAAALAKANNDLATGKTELTTNEMNYKTALIAVEKAKQDLVASTQAKNTATSKVAIHGQLASKLNETALKADEALAVLKDDAALVAMAQSVKALVGEKAKALETAKVDLIAKTTAEQAAIALVATNEKLAADLLAKQALIQKKVADLTATLPALQTRVQETSVAVDAIKPAVAAAQEVVSVVVREINVARGLQPSA